MERLWRRWQKRNQKPHNEKIRFIKTEEKGVSHIAGKQNCGADGRIMDLCMSYSKTRLYGKCLQEQSYSKTNIWEDT